MNATKVTAEGRIRMLGSLLEAPADEALDMARGWSLTHGETDLVQVGRQLEKVREFLREPPVRSDKKGLDWFHSEEKRDFDLALCEVLVPVFLPVVATAALLVTEEDGKPPFFVQERIGLGGRPFGMYKIRSMKDTRGSGPSRGPGDERATEVGRLLRSSIIDEYPQLWNIYRGEMTWCSTRALVGSEISRSLGAPQEGDLALTMEEVLGPGRFQDWYDRFYKLVSPGLVSPFGNESVRYGDRDREFFLTRWKLDTQYRDSGCLELDLEHLRIKMDDSLSALVRGLPVVLDRLPGLREWL